MPIKKVRPLKANDKVLLKDGRTVAVEMTSKLTNQFLSREYDGEGQQMHKAYPVSDIQQVLGKR